MPVSGKVKNLKLKSFRLKRNLSPIMIWVIMIGGIDLMLLLSAFSRKEFDFGAIWSIVFISLLAAFIIYQNLCYTITWNGASIIQTAFGLHRITIEPSAITAIRSESSNIGTLVRANRPSNRIAIYAGENRFIDISLKHFQFDDIRKLVGILHELRPDLSWNQIPSGFLRESL